MAPKTMTKENGPSRNDNITFIRQMLGELRQVAEKERADMLCYLLEMAYVEAGDIQATVETASIQHGKGY